MKTPENAKYTSAKDEPIIRETSSDIQQAGLRVTLPRKKILSIFEEAPDAHYSAEDIAAILRNNNEEVGLATVYRVLAQFEKAGLLIRNTFNDGKAIYELDTGHQHHHMICLCCGNIVEFSDSIIEARQQQIARSHQFEVNDYVLTLFGVCCECKEKNTEECESNKECKKGCKL
jgi:Fur family ferric uptake transcriptional regulator